ncbi:hypothetical protein [Caldiplasma sukawensis]
MTAAPGIAISALTFSPIKHRFQLVFYKKNENTSPIDISKSKYISGKLKGI